MASTKSPKVGVLMGSPHDAEVMNRASDTLKKLDLPHEVLVRSAHRCPDETVAYVKEAGIAVCR